MLESIVNLDSSDKHALMVLSILFTNILALQQHQDASYENAIEIACMALWQHVMSTRTSQFLTLLLLVFTKNFYGHTVRFGHDASVCGDAGRVIDTAVDTSGSSNATPLPTFLAF